MARYAVIADDLTGAGDSGVHFAAAGLRTALALEPVGIGRAFTEHDAVAFSTESRFLPAEEAADRVGVAINACRQAGASVFFKKIDSTLRGNLAAEIGTAMREGRFAAAVVCPAMPKTGRTVVEGRLYVGGVPVDRTELGCDPFNPVPSSFIPDLLSGLSCGGVSLEVVRKGEAAVAERIGWLVADGRNAIIVDAESDSDMAILGAATRSRNSDGGQCVLPVGAGGFAEAFAGEPRPRRGEEASGRLLAVVGSLTAASAEQISHAGASGLFTVLELDMERVLADPAGEIARLAEAAENSNRHLLLANARPPRKASASGVSRDDGLAAAALFGRAAREIAVKGACGRVYATGGGTAVAVAAAMGFDSITLERECMPGVVLGSCRSPDVPVRWFITKAGGFGASDTLTRLVGRPLPAL